MISTQIITVLESQKFEFQQYLFLRKPDFAQVPKEVQFVALIKPFIRPNQLLIYSHHLLLKVLCPTQIPF